MGERRLPGSLLGDVEALAVTLEEANTTPEAAAAIPGLLAELGRDRDLEARLREQFYEPMRRGLPRCSTPPTPEARRQFPWRRNWLPTSWWGQRCSASACFVSLADASFPRELAEFVVRA